MINRTTVDVRPGGVNTAIMENAGPVGAAVGNADMQLPNTSGSMNSNTSNDLNHEKYRRKILPTEERESVNV